MTCCSQNISGRMACIGTERFGCGPVGLVVKKYWSNDFILFLNYSVLYWVFNIKLNPFSGCGKISDEVVCCSESLGGSAVLATWCAFISGLISWTIPNCWEPGDPNTHLMSADSLDEALQLFDWYKTCVLIKNNIKSLFDIIIHHWWIY